MGQPGTLMLWFWGVGQATCIGLATWGLLAVGSRLAPSVRARMALCALWLMSFAPVLMLVPFSGWGVGNIRPATSTDAQAVRQVVELDSPDGSATIDWNQVVTMATDWLVIEVDESSPSLAAAPSPWSWGQWALYWIVGCVAYGGLRMLAGLWQIHALRSQARPCGDQRLLRIGRECQAALQLNTPIEWLQHSDIGGPAVVGLRKPAIILPAECSSWSDEQLRCAIGHELAHVKRHDVQTTLAAQVALVFNYFHPVGHILARRLRLDQELAADCLAAPLVGGGRAYLETLAALALHRNQVSTSGPALAFLPARRTFVRRLEMLRNLRLASSQATRWQSIALPVCLVSLALSAMFLRPTLAQVPVEGKPKLSVAASGEALAQTTAPASDKQPASPAQPSDSLPDLLNYLPDAASLGVMMVDVEKLLQSQQLSTLLSQLPPEQRVLKLPVGKLNVDDVEHVMLVLSGLDGPKDASLAIRFKPGKPIPQSIDQQELQTKSYGFVPPMTMLDARTVLLGSNPAELKPLLMLATVAGDRGELKDLIRRHSESPIRAALRVSSLRPAIEPMAAQLGFLGPLWRDVTTASIGLQLNESLQLEATLDSSRPDVVRETLEAVKTLARNALASPVQPVQQSRSKPAHELMLLQMARAIGNSVLENVEITEQPTGVQVTTHLDQPAPALVSLIVPTIQNARQASMRAQHSNSLKQIALAMHNYHDTYGHFPPAIINENGIERSWRVELLPFLEQAALYNQYRKDEPWDGPNNKRLGMIQIPVYAPLAVSTTAPFDPSLTPMRGMGGQHGLLGKVGRKITDITDGTSNTLMVVQVKDMVPWTKPEEYAPTPEALLQAAGQTNGFLAAFADGSVRFLSSTINPQQLQALITINGGETIGELP